MKKKEEQQNHSTTKQLSINMFFSVVAFVLNLGISFFITPYITSQFGSEAYGFVKLADDFTGYATLFSIALNSMASRFLMLERERGNLDEAKRYFSSITLANVVLSAIMAVPSIICVIYLDKFLQIPPALVSEVKLTFAITFTGFISNLLFSTYGNCFYLTNKISLGAIRESLTTILRVAAIILLFALATPRISFLAIGTLFVTVLTILYNCYFTAKLTPEFRFRLADFQWKKLWEVLAAGIWNSITRLSQILASGLDLLLTNTMISSQMMGYFSIAKTLPNLVVNFSAAIANVFTPNFMMLYARNDIAELKKATKTAVKFMCLFVSIPNAILITMGSAFFALWIPGEPAELINLLTVLTIINTSITGPTQPLYHIFTITNKIRENSIVSIVQGFASILVSYICLRLTNWGVYVLTSVGIIGTLIVTLCYHVPFAAKYIGLPKHTFFPEIGISVISTAILCAVGLAVRTLIPVDNSWILWFAGAGLTGLLGLCINAMLILNKEERAALLHEVAVRILKKR